MKTAFALIALMAFACVANTAMGESLCRQHACIQCNRSQPQQHGSCAAVLGSFTGRSTSAHCGAVCSIWQPYTVQRTAVQTAVGSTHPGRTGHTTTVPACDYPHFSLT
jgi:hypothetical protein